MIGLKPKKFTKENIESLRQKLSSQQVGMVASKSLDPENFPVFEVPVNSKVLVYVPNHVTINKDGEEELVMDKPWIHSIKEGNRFSSVRCISGMGPNEGYPEGCTCPFCVATSESWDLAKMIINEKCGLKGLDPEDKNNEEVKKIRSAAFNDRVVKDPNRYYTFPIVVIETDPSDIKKIVRDEEGNISYKLMWYTISERAYEDKWVKVLEGMEDAPSHPGGRCFILNYTYTPKSGEPNKRDSARNLAVVPRKLKGFEECEKFFDEISKDWDNIKAFETVADNVLAEYDDLENACEKVMLSTRSKIALYKSMEDSDESALPDNGGFNLSNNNGKESTGLDTDEEIGGMETDLDE